MSSLTIEFPTEELKQEFAGWMCDGGGEQAFFDALHLRNIVKSCRFGYHGIEKTEYPRNDSRRYGKFLEDNTIRFEILEPEC